MSKVREHGPDVAILDVMMPGVDGLTAAREIMTERLAAVVILTAYSQRDLVEQARDAGAMAYLIKPFQQEELVPAIELAVARFREMEILAKEAESLTDRLETRKILDRAKGKLQDSSRDERAGFVSLPPEDGHVSPHIDEGDRGGRAQRRSQAVAERAGVRRPVAGRT